MSAQQKFEINMEPMASLLDLSIEHGPMLDVPNPPTDLKVPNNLIPLPMSPSGVFQITLKR